LPQLDVSEMLSKAQLPNRLYSFGSADFKKTQFPGKQQNGRLL
jgi:hypothetical protein